MSAKYDLARLKKSPKFSYPISLQISTKCSSELYTCCQYIFIQYMSRVIDEIIHIYSMLPFVTVFHYFFVKSKYTLIQKTIKIMSKLDGFNIDNCIFHLLPE